MTVDVVLPCLNEAEALPWVLSRLPSGFAAVVADNGSTDGSAALARAAGATVVEVAARGFGAAVHAGLLACHSDVVCVCDADGSFDLAQLPRVAAPVLAGEADLMLGRRVPAAPGVWPLHARLGNRVLMRRVARRSGLRLGDLGPMRAFRRAAVRGLCLRDRRFGYPLEMVLRAAEAGWQVGEVDVDYLPRAGRSKVTGTVRGTVRTVRDMQAVLAS